MDEQMVWDLLARVGAVQDGHFQDGAEHADRVVVHYDALAHPVLTDVLATTIANGFESDPPDLVLVMQLRLGLPSLLLAFRVGAIFDRPVITLSDQEGILEPSGPMGPGRRVMLVGDVLSDRDIQLARSHVEQTGAIFVGAKALVSTARDGLPFGLVSLDGHRFSPSDCPQCRGGEPLDDLPASVVGIAR